jgi:hypothetical protein
MLLKPELTHLETNCSHKNRNARDNSQDRGNSSRQAAPQSRDNSQKNSSTKTETGQLNKIQPSKLPQNRKTARNSHKTEVTQQAICPQEQNRTIKSTHIQSSSNREWK